MRITHVISNLGAGGAEMMLYRLVSVLARKQVQCNVISLMDGGIFGEKIQALGVPVTALGMRRGTPDPRGLAKLVWLLGKGKPHLVQTWMYHADLLGGVAAKLVGVPVVWGVHHTDLSPQRNKKSTIVTAKLCTYLSHVVPSRIVCCSNATAKVHEALGYAAKRMTIITNGYDPDTYKPDEGARRAVRAELCVSDSAILIGLVGRLSAEKDHQNFIAAAKIISSRYENINFVLCGNGANEENRELKLWLDEAGVRGRFHLLGQRNDTPRIYAALDIGGISSNSEGFPNVVAEAMACGKPCVVTDVGDAAVMVDDTGIVVPPRDPVALASGWDRLILLGSEGRSILGARARDRVVRNYSLESTAARYQSLYEELTVNSKSFSFR